MAELASDTEPANDASRRAHRAPGFREVERTVHYRKPLRQPAGQRGEST